MISSLTFASLVPETRGPNVLSRLTIVGKSPNIVALIIKSAQGQTADVINFNDANGNPLLKITNANGTTIGDGTSTTNRSNLFCGQLTTTSFTNLASNAFQASSSTGACSIYGGATGYLGIGPSVSAPDAFITYKATANIQIGGKDAAAPIAQILSVQSVIAGTSNTNGSLWTFKDSTGTGTGTSGGYALQVAPAGTTGTAQNAYTNAVTIDSTKKVTIFGSLAMTTEYDNGNGGSSIAINWLNGNRQKVTLNSATCAITFTNGAVGSCQLRIIQDGSGGRLFTLPTSSTYFVAGGTALVAGAAANNSDIMGVYFDGTNWHVAMSVTNSKAIGT